MYKKFIFLLWFIIPFFCMAQRPLSIEYEYDASGNRTARKVILIYNKAPQVPSDSIETNSLTMNDLVETDIEMRHVSASLNDLAASLPAEYYVEKIANVEIKIYPNPTTENITFEFSGVDVETWHISTSLNDHAASLQLYSLTGQLLQTQQVNAAKTIVSLAGLPKGAYILMVHINNRAENWKIIKH
jgi:hypothetical protein